MRIATILLTCVAGTLASNHGQSGYSPVKKVVEMLSDMLAKGKKEKQDEVVRFAAFKQFCESTTVEKQKNIALGKEEAEALEAEIAKAGADAAETATSISALDADVAAWTEDLAKTKAERATEHAAYEEAHTAYIVSIDSVARALKMLEKGPGAKVVAQSFAQKSSMDALLQIPTHKMPSKVRQEVMAFVQRLSPEKALLQEAEDEGITIVNPTASAFEGSSGGIIDMINRLGEKFEDEKRALEKSEANQLSAFQMMQQDLTAQVSSATSERSSKQTFMTKRKEDGAGAKGGLADTQATVAEDEKFLADLDSECKQKSYDFQQRQVVRTGEIEAIGKAIEIMSGTAGSADKHMGFVQKPKKQLRSLVQVRSDDYSPTQDAVANFLEQKAQATNSRVLALLASKAASDPFDKVKKMIQDMITKLMEEANAEAEHKSFCDAEMTTNKQTRDKKTAQSEQLEADIEELTSDIATLGTEIADLAKQLAEIDSAVMKATADRNGEKSKNQETIVDAKTAEAAVGQAIALLKDFYAKAAVTVPMPQQDGPIAWDDRAIQILDRKSASFLQVASVNSGKAKLGPEMEAGSYTGMEGGGVLGLMEVCQSDFSKLVAETEATETEAARIFDEFKADSAQDKAVKEMDQKHKIAAKSEKESSLSQAKKDIRIVAEELQAAMDYYEKLKPDCESKVMSYAEKVAQRDAEIESLKEALSILAGGI
jgi:hypothetical protein